MEIGERLVEVGHQAGILHTRRGNGRHDHNNDYPYQLIAIEHMVHTLGRASVSSRPILTRNSIAREAVEVRPKKSRTNGRAKGWRISLAKYKVYDIKPLTRIKDTLQLDPEQHINTIITWAWLAIHLIRSYHYYDTLCLVVSLLDICVCWTNGTGCS